MAINIPKTMIGTSDPISICRGLGLFPPFPNIGAGIHGVSDTHALINHNFSFLAVRAKAAASFGYFIGCCGPGYGIKMLAEGEVNGRTLTLAVSEDDTIGGFAFGTNFFVSGELQAQVYKFHWAGWHSHFSWDTSLDAHLDIQFDFLAAALDIILAALQLESLFHQVEPVKDTLKSSFSLMGEAEDSYASSQNQIVCNCKFMVPINCWPLIVALSQAGDELGIGEVVLAFNALLNATLSSIGFGPTVGIGVPVNVGISSVSLDDVKFDYTATTSDGKWQGNCDATATPPNDPKEMTFTLRHTAGFDIRVGLYAELQLVEIFHVGASVDTGVLSLLNIVPDTSPFYQTLKNNVGSESVAAARPDLLDGSGLSLVEFA